ncbi:MAG: response regulator [Spirochaetota bacterium]
MKQVLIVDDSAMVRNIVALALKMQNYEVTQASDGLEALEKVAEMRFDFGIFDVNMPNISGLELIPKVLATDNGKDMKIVMLTTESSDEMRAQAQKSGAKAWIVKPFENENLLALLQGLDTK